MPEHFFGRQHELARLDQAYGADRAQIGLVYGQRRLGKTTLLQRFCLDKPSVFFTASDWDDAIELEAFSKAVAQFCRTPMGSFTSWRQAWRALAQSPCAQRKVIVIDEFHHLVHHRPHILQELRQTCIEEPGASNILLILASSAPECITRMLDAEQPLSECTNFAIALAPLSFADVAQFAPDDSIQERFEAYAALGGVPYYWVCRRRASGSLPETLLRSDGALADEMHTLLRSHVREVAPYQAILRAMAWGATERRTIARASGIDSRVIGHYLRTLQSLDVINIDACVFSDTDHPGEKACESYRINDACVRFWFRYVLPNPAIVTDSHQAQRLWQSHVAPDFEAFAAPAFAQVCRQYLWRQHLAGHLPFAVAHFGRWPGIAIVAADSARKQCLIAQCQYRHQKMGLADLRHLYETSHQLPMAADATVHVWLFSKSGFEAALQDEARMHPRIHLVAMDALLD